MLRFQDAALCVTIVGQDVPPFWISERDPQSGS